MYDGNIVFVKDSTSMGSPSARWLCEWPAQVLAQAGYFVDQVSLIDVLHPSRRQIKVIADADTIIYERHVDDAWMPFLQMCAKEKQLFITLDDAYWEADPSTNTYAFWSQNDRLDKLFLACSWAKGVIVPSRKLAQCFLNGIFRPNRPNFQDPCWIISPLFSDMTIMWGGSMAHIAGMREHPCLEAIKTLCKGGKAKFIGLSGSPELTAILEQVPNGSIYSWYPYEEWLRVLSGTTIAVCPIGQGYDEYRSWIKALEASAAGTAWVGSRGVYSEVGNGGILVNDTYDEWYEALSSLLEDKDRRDTLMEKGRIWAWKQGLHDHLDEWEAILND